MTRRELKLMAVSSVCTMVLSVAVIAPPLAYASAGGSPTVKAALADLQSARAKIDSAIDYVKKNPSANTSGHLANARSLTQQAIDEINQALAVRGD